MQSSVRYALALFALSLATAGGALGVNYSLRESRVRTFAEHGAGGQVSRAEDTFARYGCGGCHEIPGLSGASGKVGPSLDGFGGRTAVAGVLPNQPDSLALWIREPQKVKPGTGMPNQGVSDGEARDMAAYLYTLR
jgi:cytochrome c1